MTTHDPAFDMRFAAPCDVTAVTELLAASYPPVLAGAYEPDRLAQLLRAIMRAKPG
jgi:hypothetical protein